LVEVEAAAVSFVDGLIARGLYQVRPPLPYTPGMAWAGRVRAIGEGVTNGPAVGSAVAAVSMDFGGYASHVVVPDASSAAVPDGVDLTVAASAAESYSLDGDGAGSSWEPEVYVGLGLAGAISAALLVARRRQRAGYRPGSGHRDDALPIGPVVYQLRLAHQHAQASLDEPRSLERKMTSPNLARRPSWADPPMRPPRNWRWTSRRRTVSVSLDPAAPLLPRAAAHGHDLCPRPGGRGAGRGSTRLARRPGPHRRAAELRPRCR
jgi:hypothetical protein